LYPVKGTNWVLAFAGWGGVETFYRALQSEVELGHVPAFDPHIEIGGLAYLTALMQKATKAGGKMPQSPTILAGFDIDQQPYILAAVLPDGAPYKESRISARGAQNSTALWILNTLIGCCTSLEDVKKLAYFTISQVAKQELKVGGLEDGYAISMAVLESDKPNHYESLENSTLNGWLKDWETGLQKSFMEVIRQSASHWRTR
jgi:hypothetical protein